MLIKWVHQKNLIFITIGFKYEPYLCNGCYGLMQKAMNFNDVAIVYVKGNAYRIHFWYVSKDDGIRMMNNSNLVDKGGLFVIFFLLIYKIWMNLLKKLIIKRTKLY